MYSDSDEEIFNRYATNDRRARPKKKMLTLKRKKSKDKQSRPSNFIIASPRVYLFNFFLFSSLGSLMPFLPVFFKLLGFTSLQNGILFAVRPLISFWWGPFSASLATSTRYRQLLLFVFVAGAVASTFCLSVVRTNDGGILSNANCKQIIQGANDRGLTRIWHATKKPHYFPENSTGFTTWKLSSDNDTTPYSWKTYIKNTSKKIYHQLQKGIVMKNLFLSVFILTVASELFLSPALHVTQASIKFTSRQPLLNNQCLNRVFCKIGMTVAALSISYVAWKYECIFKNVHYFYFHFYGFLATGCITAMTSLALPTESPQKTSFFKMVCNSFISVVFDWGNFVYIFGLWIAGIAEGTISAYLLWYATVNGASEIVIGILVSLAIVTDMMLHFTVGFSMKWIGHMGLLSVGIFLLSIQFFILVNVSNPYYMVPTQLLFGIASCCIRSSFIGCANSNGTKEIEKVLFFVFQASYMGLGLGLGGIFVSMPYFVFGAQKTFSALGVMTAMYSLLFFLVQLITCKRKRRTQRSDKGMYTKLNTCEPNSDWLVDAMREDEEEEETKKTQEEHFMVEENEVSNTESQLGKDQKDQQGNNNKEDLGNKEEANMPALT